MTPRVCAKCHGVIRLYNVAFIGNRWMVAGDGDTARCSLGGLHVPVRCDVCDELFSEDEWADRHWMHDQETCPLLDGGTQCACDIEVHAACCTQCDVHPAIRPVDA